VLAIARTLPLLARVPARLLPRDLGAPTLFGAAQPFGLLGSPADLLLTSLALLAAAVAVRAFVEGNEGARGARGRLPVASAAAILSAASLAGVCLALARNTQVPVLDGSGI